MQTIQTENRPIRDILRELNERLIAEGVHAEEYDFSELLPENDSKPTTLGTERWLICYPVRGGSEGHYVHIATIHQSASGNAHRIVGVAKCYSTENAWELVHKVNQLLDLVDWSPGQ